MRVTTKGQVTIPKEIRDRLGIGPGSEVEFLATDDGVRVVPVSEKHSRRRGFPQIQPAAQSYGRDVGSERHDDGGVYGVAEGSA
ncbi:MAG: AbrB/MazE/SpoVT family DNA-binding domain-containing protein [Mesorhizobium sp.]|nr:MAG: AbrB/MazE/SpoVT family DNA-binding domain-containing protein [Mesorhizobium sp.]RWK63725.1 MAG: AbrB/MazE/SpoVT family DNA-binding domain-containing protein [Mesorhizobium sp.]RWK72139.1 MAG: AbrB/MazE/SpoVT family DNA-binding domain-containing protein [Mesorhizobium sp.]RWK84635.1 MAG: AbrB/MazE/SpoVT family DNA-binding domain-containing protein [Mesorhizobium sp.]RWL01958.1 MAG: AbrB/MazE/SpoVT family DNA-binding domain-containing protein [Mesorhizobium sp.]